MALYSRNIQNPFKKCPLQAGKFCHTLSIAWASFKAMAQDWDGLATWARSGQEIHGHPHKSPVGA